MFSFGSGFHMQNALTLELWSQDSIHIPYDHAATLELGQLRHKLEKREIYPLINSEKIDLEEKSKTFFI